ncbi:MAG: trypsin-like serine peptidase [Enterobacteriaceae bacterium]
MKRYPFSLLSLLVLQPIASYGTPIVYKGLSIENGPTQNSQQVEQYWTPERIASAIPMPAPGERAQPRSKETLQQSRCLNAEDIPGEPVDVNKRPYWNIGQLYFSDDSGETYYCTAEVAGQNNILLTAAHCLYDTDTSKWYKNFLFRQQSRCEHYTKQMTLSDLSVDSRYITLDPRNSKGFDYAFAKLSDTSASGDFFQLSASKCPPQQLGDVTIIGYPGVNLMRQFTGVAAINTGTPYTIYANFPARTLRGGASGGPWVANISEQSGPDNNVIVGVTYGEDGHSGNWQKEIAAFPGQPFYYLFEYVSGTKGALRLANPSPSDLSRTVVPALRLLSVSTILIRKSTLIF